MKSIKFLKSCSQYPYFIVGIFFIAFLLYVNYDYYLLGKKIIPVKIPLKFAPIEKTIVVSNNFASDVYVLKLLLSRKVYDKNEDAFDKIRETLKNSAVNIEIFEDDRGRIYNQTIQISRFEEEFVHRDIDQGCLAFSLTPHAFHTNSDDGSKFKIKLLRGEKYRIIVTPSSENKQLNKLSPQLIFFGVDDGYYGVGYFFYSALLLILWAFVVLVIFTVKLAFALLRKKSHDIILTDRKSALIHKFILGALMIIWPAVATVIFHNSTTNEMGKFFTVIIMLIFIPLGNLILFAIYSVYRLFVHKAKARRVKNNDFHAPYDE